MNIKQLRAALNSLPGDSWSDILMTTSDGDCSSVEAVRLDPKGFVFLCWCPHEEGLDQNGVCPRDVKCIQVCGERLVDRVSGNEIPVD